MKEPSSQLSDQTDSNCIPQAKQYNEMKFMIEINPVIELNEDQQELKMNFETP